MPVGNGVGWKAKLFCLIFLIIPLSAYAVDAGLGNQALNKPVSQQAASIETKPETFMGKLSGFTQSFKADDGYGDFGLRFGYIYGQNSFDYNHHTSELEYPFRSYVGGGKLNFGYKDFSLNSEFWGSLFDDPSAGWHTKDKDWEDGQLTSDTKSYSDMNAVIWDTHLRYTFFNYAFGRKKSDTRNRKAENIKLGVLLGFRYERFGYKDFGLYQTNDGTGSHGDGELVSEYKVRYRLPYCGLGLDIGNEKFGMQMNAKYGFSARARDLDNHVLQSRTNYGDYKKNPNIFMGNFALYWKFYQGWEASLGGEAALIRLNGTTWEETRNPDWDADQNIDTQQFIYWMGLGYKF